MGRQTYIFYEFSHSPRPKPHTMKTSASDKPGNVKRV